MESAFRSSGREKERTLEQSLFPVLPGSLSPPEPAMLGVTVREGGFYHLLNHHAELH